MKKPAAAAVMKTPAMKKQAGGKCPTPCDGRSGSNSPMPPMSDELLQLQADLVPKQP